MVCHHRISSTCECRRMMRPKLLKVTRTSLTTCYTSLCDSSRCNTYSLSKSLIIKHRWCLTSIPWTPSTSSSSTSHSHCLNDKLNIVQYLQGINTAPRHYSYTQISVYTKSLHSEAMQNNLSNILNHIYQ